jgi:hypothetical protein
MTYKLLNNLLVDVVPLAVQENSIGLGDNQSLNLFLRFFYSILYNVPASNLMLAFI